MAYLKVHRNLKAGREAGIPYLLDVQHPVLERLASRMVIPLIRRDAASPDLAQINLAVDVAGERLLLSVPEIGAVPASRLGEVVADLSPRRYDIQHAVDFLMTGF